MWNISLQEKYDLYCAYLMCNYFNFVHTLHCLGYCTQFYCSNQMQNINYVYILKAYLRHVSGQVYHLQGEQNASFETNCKW